MDILTAINNLKNIQVFGTYFSKTGVGALTVARNIYATDIVITNGTSEVGVGSQYDEKYVIACEDGELVNVTTAHGNIGYSNTLSLTDCINNDFSNVKITNIFDFATMYSQISAYSTFLSGFKNNVTKRYQSGVYSFTGTNDINYITMDSSEITKLGTTTLLKLNFKKDSIVIFNFINGDAVYYNSPVVEFVDSNIDESNIIFNFGTSNATISGQLFGSTISSTGWISLENATVYGSVYGNSIFVVGTTTIEDVVLSIIDKLPLVTLDNPDITIELLDDNSLAKITVNNLGEYTTSYSIDNGEYVEYVEPLNIIDVGLHSISFINDALGYINSETINYIFEITCQCNNPTLSQIGNDVLALTDVLSAKIHYTIDGTTPNENSEYVLNNELIKIPNDGYYVINAIAIDSICKSSGITSIQFSVEYPEDIITIDILSPMNLDGTYQDVNGQGVLVSITHTIPSNSIYYVTTNSNPRYGTLYTGEFYTKSNIIKATSYAPYSGESDIVTKNIVIVGNFYIEKTYSDEISNNKLDLIANTAEYSEDIGWLGPTVVVDGTAIYQALVNILATPVLEIPFNPLFGVSIHHKLFELSEDLSSDTIIYGIKNEIEYNDPRIEIMEHTSFAHFVEGLNKIVIELDWKNRFTDEIAHVRYGYDLDGIMR